MISTPAAKFDNEFLNARDMAKPMAPNTAIKEPVWMPSLLRTAMVITISIKARTILLIKLTNVFSTCALIKSFLTICCTNFASTNPISKISSAAITRKL